VSRTQILADRISEPITADALRTHARERDEILADLTKSLEAEVRVKAAWLWGSFMRGEQDDLSDLDLWLLVDDDCVETFDQTVAAWCAKAGEMVSGAINRHNSPPDGLYFGALLAGTHGLHHLDIYWQPTGQYPPQGANLLANRQPQKQRHPIPLPPNPPTNLAFVWLMISVAAKYLARDPASDMQLLTYPRNAFEESVKELGLQEAIGQVEWECPEEPQGKVEVLRELVRKTKRLDEGYGAPPSANRALTNYIDLVGVIVASR